MTSIVSPRSDGEPRSRRVERIRGTGRERRRQIFEEAVAVIDIAAGDPHVSVDAIARAVLTSRRQVQRAFAEAGTTVRDVLRRARMERAERLLDDYRLSIADVGRLVGYEQAAEFARTFRRHAGCTPSEGRRARAHPGSIPPGKAP
jgi:AraC family transcriptional regulator of adaptative response / methylphosphotriester-DNA alkyltransferase methyltransferase